MEQPEHPPSALRIDVSGYKRDRWTKRARAALIRGMGSVFKRLSQTKVNPDTGETLGDETKKLTAKSLKRVEATLDAPGIENQQKLAQIEKTFEEREQVRAQTRKTEAEARKIEAETEAQQLANADAKFTLYKKLVAFEKRTGKKVAGAILGEPADEFIVLPKSLVPFLREKTDSLTLDTEEAGDVASSPLENKEEK